MALFRVLRKEGVSEVCTGFLGWLISGSQARLGWSRLLALWTHSYRNQNKLGFVALLCERSPEAPSVARPVTQELWGPHSVCLFTRSSIAGSILESHCGLE